MSTFETNPIQLQRPDMPYIIYTTLYINRTKVVQSGWLRSFKQRLFSFAQSCLILHVPMDFSTPGFPGLHYLLEFAQTHVHWVADAIQLSHPPLLPFSSCLPSFPASGSFSVSQFFASGGQSIGASVSTSFLPVNIQGWSPLELTGWISLQSKGLSRVFSSTTNWKHQLFGAQPSLEVVIHNLISPRIPCSCCC